MAADTQRKAYRYTCNMVRPQIYSEKSLMESVVDFFSDVVPQAYTGTQKNEDKEKIQWVRFENCDCNDVAKNPDMFRSDTKGLPLLLILGYSNGVQIWNITPNGEAQEILSMRQGPVRICRMLANPDPVLGHCDSYSSKRPLVVLCDSSSAGQPYCGVKFVSLKTGDEVHSISFKTLPVQNIECNKRFLVIVFLEKICVHEACQFQQLFWITSCFPCSGPNVNPIALSSRWLAYADKRLVAMHQSCGGMSGDGSQSYAATVLSAAKGAFKGLSMFGEAMVSSVTGSKATPPKRDYVQLDNGNRPGIVTVVDIQNIHNDHFNVNEDNEGDGLIAHFHAHANEPVSNLAFDPTGTLLVTACKLGHNFHVFRLMAHPVSSSLGAVHHLYTLHRGETTAKVIDISFNHDSRWITVSSHRGTTHLFPITPYGGSVNVRTHCKPHVVNRASRFHRSAGLDEFDHSVGRRSPVLSTSPSSSGQYDRYPTLIQQNTLNNNMGNPRLPPYPHPITICPAFQVKQPLNVVLNPGNKNQSPSHSPTGFDNVYCVCAKFCTPRLCVVGSPKLDMERREAGKRPVDSLFVMAQSGTLVEYVLEPRAKSVTDKVTDDCMLELNVVGRMQWNLQRLKNSQELRPPLPSNSPLILAHEAVTSQIPTAPDLYDLPGLTRQDSKDSLSSDHSGKDDSDEQWLSQVEIITHAGPHRRLWMGPQFSFKTYQENTTVLSSTSSSLLSQSPESNMAAMDLMGDEGDLESLKLQPTRSNPVSMPNARPAYRRLSGSDSSPVPGQGVGAQSVPMVIEAGSFDQSPHLLDVYSNWTESSVAKQPRGSDDLEEDRLKETLADAMVESPCKDIEKLSLRHQDIPRTSVKPEKTRSQTRTRSTSGYNDKADVGNVVKGSGGVDADGKVVARKENVEIGQKNMDKKTVKPAKKSSDEGISIEGSGKCADSKVEGSVVDKSQKGHSELEDNKTNAESNKNGKKKGKAKKSLDSQLKDVSKSVVDEKLVNNTDAAEKVQAPTVESSVSSSSSKAVKRDASSPDKTQSIPQSKKPSDKKAVKCDASSPDKTQSIPESKKPSDKRAVKRDVSSPDKTQSIPESKKSSDKKAVKRDVSSPDKTQSIPESKKPSDKNGSNSGRYCASSNESTLVLSESKHIAKACTKPCIDKINGNECPELISSPNVDTVGMLDDKKSSSGKQDMAKLNDISEKVEMVNKAVDDKSTNFLSEKVVESDGRVSPQKSKSKKKSKKQGKSEMTESVMKTEEALASAAQEDCPTSIEVIERVNESKSDESDDVEQKKKVQFEIVSDEIETQIKKSLQTSVTNQTLEVCEDDFGFSSVVKDTDIMCNDKNVKTPQQTKHEETDRVIEQDVESSFAQTKSKKKKKKENVNSKRNDEKLNTDPDKDTEKQTDLKNKKTQHDSVLNDDTYSVSFAGDYKSMTVSVDVNLEVEESDLEVVDVDIVHIESKSKDTVESKDDISPKIVIEEKNAESKEFIEETANIASSSTDIETKHITPADIDGTKKTTQMDNLEMTEVKSKKKRKKKKNGMDESVYFEKSEAPSKSVDCEKKKTKDESEKSTKLALSSAAVPTVENNCALAPLELSKEPQGDVVEKKLDDSDRIEKADVNSIKTMTDDGYTSKAGPDIVIKKTNSTEMFYQQGNGQDDNVSLDGEKQAEGIESKSSASSKDSDNWFADETVVVQKKKNKKKRKNVESKVVPTRKSPEPEVVDRSVDSASMETLVDNYGSDNTAFDNAKSSSSQRDVEVIPGTADSTKEVTDIVELVDPLLNNDDIHGSNGGQLKSIYTDDAIDDLSDVKKMEDSAESGSKYETAESAEDDPSVWERSEFEECLEENILDEIPVDEEARSDKIGKLIVEEMGEDCVKDRKKITFEDQSEANENNVEKQVNQNVESNNRSPGSSDSKLDSNASVMGKSMYDDSAGSSSRSSEEREDAQPVKNVNSKAEGKTKKKKRKNKR